MLFEPQVRLLTEVLAGRSTLAHALLVSGRPGIGKAAFAAALAQALLCPVALARSSPGAPAPACGQCDECRWFAAGTHPDFQLLERLVDDQGKVATEISIDQVRALESMTRLTAFRGGARVVVVDPTETLNASSANALLKLLEEPGPGLYLLLVTHRPDRLPATIRSRCRQVVVPGPAQAEALAWLVATAGFDAAQARTALAWTGGAPLHARRLAGTASMTAYRSWVDAIASLPDTGIVTAADSLPTEHVVVCHAMLQRWIADLARVQAGAGPKYFPDSVSRLRQLAGRCRPSGLLKAEAGVQQQAALTGHPLNPRLFLEESFALYAEAFDRG